MKKTLVTSLMLLNVATATADDAFEIISLSFKDGITYEQQEKAMLSLNEIVKTFDGFKSRDFFYSKENNRWIDFVVWSNLSLAKKASEVVMSNPKAGKVFALIDQEAMIFSYYDQIGGIKQNTTE